MYVSDLCIGEALRRRDLHNVTDLDALAYLRHSSRTLKAYGLQNLTPALHGVRIDRIAGGDAIDLIEEGAIFPEAKPLDQHLLDGPGVVSC